MRRISSRNRVTVSTLVANCSRKLAITDYSSRKPAVPPVPSHNRQRIGLPHPTKALQRPNVFIVASAIGYYGDRGNENLREQSPAGQGFLAEVCKQWEAAAQAAADAGIRTAHTRFGIVLSKKGGALPAMLTPFKL